MATGGQKDSEDSGYLSVNAPQSRERKTYRRTESKVVSKEADKETNELNAIKILNRKLVEKIKTLQQKINEQSKKFHDDKMNMIRSHKRETDNFKKIHDKTLDRLAAKSQDIKTQWDEINKMKLIIESVRKSEKELRVKIENTRKDGKYTAEYEKQKREMSASKEDIRRLEEQIAILETTIAEQDKEISEATIRNVDLSSEIERLVKKDDMKAMENNILGKMEAIQQNMIENMQKLFVQNMQSQNTETETGQQSERNKRPLPSIAGVAPQSALSKETP